MKRFCMSVSKVLEHLRVSEFSHKKFSTTENRPFWRGWSHPPYYRRFRVADKLQELLSVCRCRASWLPAAGLSRSRKARPALNLTHNRWRLCRAKNASTNSPLPVYASLWDNAWRKPGQSITKRIEDYKPLKYHVI